MLYKVIDKEHLFFFQNTITIFFMHNNHFWLPLTVCVIKSEGVIGANDLGAIFGIGISIAEHQYSIWR